ncbi:MAG: Bro-N domain-containing protein [Lachnospiraceae bacterium]
MNKIKTENWNGNDIRFVQRNDEWWAVLSDIADALNLHTKKLNQRLEDEVLSKYPIKDSIGRTQETSIVNEFGIYDAVFQSRKPEAKEFRQWVYSMLKELRQATGLEGFQVFRMLDKEHQKESMRTLCNTLRNPVRVDFMKANSIANKAVSSKHGYPKMIKKGEMTPAMLVDREEILDSTVELMGVKDKYELDISVSESVYKKCV